MERCCYTYLNSDWKAQLFIEIPESLINIILFAIKQLNLLFKN